MRARWLLRMAQRAVARLPRVTRRRPHGLDAPLVVTLTSFPARFPTLAPTIRSLLDQTVAADRTILWIGAEHLSRLPAEVTALVGERFEVRGCADIRSYTKLIPSLIAFPDAFHVTADDDLYYPRDWLAALVGGYDAASPAIVAMRAHMALLDEAGMMLPYRDWELATHRTGDEGPRRRLFPTGVGGVLYPPGAFPPEVFDRETFMALCRYADDVWFFWMAERAGTQQVRLARSFDIVNWPGSQEVGLLNENWLGDRNDVQIRAMQDHFGPVP